MQRISFKPFLVDQIHADIKTETRRLITPQPPREYHLPFWLNSMPDPYPQFMAVSEVHRILWQIGNRVCVEYKDGVQRAVYASDHAMQKINARMSKQRWLPGRFMFDEFARTQIEVLEVNPEWLLDITHESAINEGVECTERGYKNYLKKDWFFDEPVESFFSLWDYINGIGAHHQNPAVYALKFTKHKI